MPNSVSWGSGYFAIYLHKAREFAHQIGQSPLQRKCVLAQMGYCCQCCQMDWVRPGKKGQLSIPAEHPSHRHLGNRIVSLLHMAYRCWLHSRRMFHWVKLHIGKALDAAQQHKTTYSSDVVCIATSKAKRTWWVPHGSIVALVASTWKLPWSSTEWCIGMGCGH